MKSALLAGALILAFSSAAGADALTRTDEWVPVGNSSIEANLWTVWRENNMVAIVTRQWIYANSNDPRNLSEYWFWCDRHAYVQPRSGNLPLHVQDSTNTQTLEQIACKSPKYHMKDVQGPGHEWVRIIQGGHVEVAGQQIEMGDPIWGMGIWVDRVSVKRKNEGLISVLVRTSGNYDPGLFFIDCAKHVGISEDALSKGEQMLPLGKPFQKELESIACSRN